MSDKTYQQENNEVLNNFLNRTFFSAWKNIYEVMLVNKGKPDNERIQINEKYLNYQAIELIMDYECNLGCKYCYVNKFGDSLYPASKFATPELIIKNTNILIDWLIENNYSPRIEFFSGEPLVQQMAFDVLNLLIDRMAGRITNITIPTNYTFLLSDKLTAKVVAILEKAEANGIHVALSASFDGKLMEDNRPFKYKIEGWENDHGIAKWKYKENADKDLRDDEWYNKAFEFNKKYSMGFHPMVYSDNIEKWRDNFLWFQDMFMKHDIPYTNMYLLEVRNPEWSKEQIKEFGKFVEFLIEWAWSAAGMNFQKYKEFLLKYKGFNILNSTLTQIGRGIGCGYQSTLCVRLADFAIVGCHRTSYDPYVAGHLIVEDGKVTKIVSNNIEYFVGTMSFEVKNIPICEQCIIKNLCQKGCLGAQMETTGDPFTPIPTVCALEHEKIWAQIRAYKRIGIWEGILSMVNEHKREGFKYMERIMIGDKNE